MSQVKDPLCGMIIDTESAGASYTYESQEVYFCSEQCGRAFQDEPERYELEKHEPPYTVSKGFVAPKFGSAVSGGLEYELGPEQHEEREQQERERKGGRKSSRK
ncbi:MAG: YHS domain-containing protein [Gemmatimonadales bacterium]